MRRSIISLVVWLSLTAVVIIYLNGSRIQMGQQLDSNLPERSLRRVDPVKNNVDEKNKGLKSNHKRSKKDNKSHNKELNTNIKQKNNRLPAKQDESNKSSSELHRKNSQELSKARRELEALSNKLRNLTQAYEHLRSENENVHRNEAQLKSLAKRLAARLRAKETGQLPKLDPDVPWVFAITPTVERFTQKADLVRLTQTLQHVTNLHWLVVEDADARTDMVTNLLRDSRLSFTHLNLRTPKEMQRKKWQGRRKHHRGVVQRNLGLQWLRDNVDFLKTPGTVYFMDDDNTYHVDIFDEIRNTKGVSMFPVGLTGGVRWAGPIVKDGKIVSFHTNWAPDRTFPIDMAGYSVSLKVLLKDKPHTVFNASARLGFLEPTFLEQLTTKEQVEPKAENCTQVLVWHTRTEVPKDSIKGEKKKPSPPLDCFV